MSYCYDQKEFVLTRFIDEAEVVVKVKSNFIEQFDHPFTRQTLYFHQLKDVDKYCKIEVPEFFPKYMKDLYRRSEVNQVLDQQNPLGVPIWSKPLIIKIEINKKQTRCGFIISSKLGKVTIKKLYNLRNKNIVPKNANYKNQDGGENSLVQVQTQKQEDTKFDFNAKLLDQKLQKTIFQIIKNKAGINQAMVEELSKLMFVGGCIDKIQLMMDIFQYTAHPHIQNENQ